MVLTVPSPIQRQIFGLVLEHVFNAAKGSTLSSPDLRLHYNVLQFFATHTPLAKVGSKTKPS